MRSEKIAISIPADVLAGAERMAKRLRKSRSQIITAAVAEYVARREPDAITEAYNRACADESEEDKALYAFVEAGANQILGDIEW